MRHAVAVIDKICNCCMYLQLYVYICLFADCKGQSIETHWMSLKLRHIMLQMLKLWRCISANENTKGC